MKIVSRSDMLRLEEATYDQGVSTKSLIWRVGIALSERLATMMESLGSKNVAIFVGPGNNGADGLVAAMNLAENGFSVHVYLCAAKERQDAELIRRLEVTAWYTDLTQSVPENLQAEISQFDIVVDAILGISKPRKIEGLLARVLEDIRGSFEGNRNRLLVAVDIPSGMDADTGQVDDLTVPVDCTIAVGYPKVGFFLNPGYKYVGSIEQLDVGLRSGLLESLHVNLTSIEDFVEFRHLLNIKVDSHKGSKGHVLAIAGSASYPGAAILAGMAAYRSGCGLVTLMAPDSIFSITAGKLPEAIHLTYPDLISDEATLNAIELVRALDLHRYDSVLLGCGISTGPFSAAFVNEVVNCVARIGDSIPMVVDADALNNLAEVDLWWEKLDRSLVLTPHPGEMSRLIKMSVEYVQRSRLETASSTAMKMNQVTVLKGAFTVVADVDGNTYVNPHANPVLGTAGSGDVLAGLIASLLAQGLPELLAVKLAVYVHGQAGEELRYQVGERGVIASDIANYLPSVLNSLAL